jgi:hypothetical protein
MLIEKIIKVKVSNRTKKFFIEKGYTEHDGYFLIEPKDMNDTNRTKVKCKCVYCDIINDVVWSNYIIQINKTEEKIYCCHKCHFNKTKIKFKQNHGVDNIQNLSYIKDKIKKTNLEKYGVECVLNSEEIKDKIKKTNIEKYGKEYSISSSFVRNKIINSFITRYGVENIFCSSSQFREDINRKLKQSLNSDDVKYKRKESCFEKYGFDNPMQSDIVKQKSKNTCLEKYGVESPMQSDILFHKQQISGLKTKKYNNTDLTYQGTYELDFIERYYNRVTIEKTNPIQYKLNENTHYYHPDFYLPDYNLIIEVKSSYTYEYDLDKNITKKEYSIKSGFNFIFIIDKDYSELESILLKSSPDN